MRGNALIGLRPSLSFLLPPRIFTRSLIINVQAPIPSQQHRSQSTLQRTIPRRAPAPPSAALAIGNAPALSSNKKPQLLRNEEITTPFVQLIDEQTKKLGPPEPIATVLSRVDATQFDLVELKPGIVRLLPVAVAAIENPAVKNTRTRTSKTSKKKAAAGGITLKTLELSYAIDKHDLSHRLEKLKEFLGKGFRVDVVLARKKGSRETTFEERKDVLMSIKKAVDEAGGSDYSGPEGTVEKGVVRLHVQGAKPAKTS